MGRWADGWRRRTREIRRRVSGVSSSVAWRAPLHACFMEFDTEQGLASSSAGELLTEQELCSDLFNGPETRLLGRYCCDDVEASLERYGLFELIRRRGWRELRVETDLADAGHQLMKITAEHRWTRARCAVVEVVLRRQRIGELDFIAIDWLQMQNPGAHFCRDKPRLPDQHHPGLGCADALVEWLMQLGLSMRLDGLVCHPSRYHIALGARGWHFLNPSTEGRFVAIRDLLRHKSVAEATRLVEQGRVQLDDGASVCWMPDDMALPLSDSLGRWFEDPGYLQRVVEAEEACIKHGIHIVRRRPIPTIVH